MDIVIISDLATALLAQIQTAHVRARIRIALCMLGMRGESPAQYSKWTEMTEMVVTSIMAHAYYQVSWDSFSSENAIFQLVEVMQQFLRHLV